MQRNFRAVVLAAAAAWSVLGGCAAVAAQTQLACGPFTQDVLAAPEPREAAWPVKRFEQIKEEVRAHAFPVLFLGDSLTQRWDEVAADHAIWDRYFRPLDALNAGVDGDRTEHLLWRVEHGDLENQRPRVAILLIGTNDLGHGRSPEDAAEGVRQVLMKLRQDLPQTRILLEALWPRSDHARLAGEIAPVSARISRCADGVSVIYRDPGRRLLDPHGRLTHAMAPDGLHPSPTGYEIVSPLIAQALRPLLTGR